MGLTSEERYRPLRYQISSWRQLPGCMSNNSKYLKLHVSDIFDGKNFRGFRILLDHEKYGVIFATVINARGLIISPESFSSENGDTVFDLPNEDILSELAKYGFFIDYHVNKHLSGKHIQYLMTVQQLHFDKIRVLQVWDASTGTKQYTRHIVVFKEEELDQWLNNGYSPSVKEFTYALTNGYALDITHVCCSAQFDWSWLNFVANIEDILRDNGGDCITPTPKQVGDDNE